MLYKGTYTYVNGNKYDGEWVNDKKHGRGVYHYYSTNEKYDGEWVRKYVKDKGK
jgi:hypothetical protein